MSAIYRIDELLFSFIVSGAFLAVFAIALLLLVHQVRKAVKEERTRARDYADLEEARKQEKKFRRLKLFGDDGLPNTEDDETVVLPPLQPNEYHIFLSHVWSSGQDQMLSLIHI